MSKAEIIIGETTKLERKGKRLIGLCPFHEEKTPSFSVSPDKGIYYCFGCHAGGDLVSFVMRTRGVGYKEALEVVDNAC